MRSPDIENIDVFALNENTISIQFLLPNTAQPTPALAQTIAQCAKSVQLHFSEYIVDIVPAYTSILIYYNFLSIPGESLISKILTKVNEIIASNIINTHEGRVIEVPTYYSEESGPDLAHMAEIKQCTVEEIITRHCQQDYCVYAIGFAPGFPYLGFVDDALKSPRLTTPRKSVAAGSVGIADAQTGIYPNTSPGGWNLIGRTPFSILNTKCSPNSPFLVGDTVRFIPIKKSEFERNLGKTL